MMMFLFLWLVVGDCFSVLVSGWLGEGSKSDCRTCGSDVFAAGWVSAVCWARFASRANAGVTASKVTMRTKLDDLITKKLLTKWSLLVGKIKLPIGARCERRDTGRYGAFPRDSPPLALRRLSLTESSQTGSFPSCLSSEFPDPDRDAV